MFVCLIIIMFEDGDDNNQEETDCYSKQVSNLSFLRPGNQDGYIRASVDGTNDLMLILQT